MFRNNRPRRFTLRMIVRSDLEITLRQLYFQTGANPVLTGAKWLAMIWGCASAPVGLGLKAYSQTGANWRKPQMHLSQTGAKVRGFG